MDDDTKQILQAAVAGLIRHAMTAAGGYLVSLGLLQADQTTEFVTIGLGIVSGAVGLAWSYYQKHQMVKEGPKP